MVSHAPLIPVSFSLAAAVAWGTSDFVGGYTARRANAFLVTSVAHAGGLLLMISLALLSGSEFPSTRSVMWALAAGLSGGAALAAFYQALSAGNMGLVATVGAVLGAAIPAVLGMITEGLPGTIRMGGFASAGLGIWLISRAEGETRPQALGLASLAGLGFAGFYLCVKQAADAPALWVATFTRSAALLLTTAIVIVTRRFCRLNPGTVAFSALAGCLDASGTALLVRASQTGRLDVAVILTSLYPVWTVVLARLILKERLTPWRIVGLSAGLLAVPLIALG
jgi:drug/metabolite transporter (DMT)-like permease